MYLSFFLENEQNLVEVKRGEHEPLSFSPSSRTHDDLNMRMAYRCNIHSKEKDGMVIIHMCIFYLM